MGDTKVYEPEIRISGCDMVWGLMLQAHAALLVEALAPPSGALPLAADYSIEQDGEAVEGGVSFLAASLCTDRCAWQQGSTLHGETLSASNRRETWKQNFKKSRTCTYKPRP